MNDENRTSKFELQPGGRLRRNAGEYDLKTRRPIYSFRVSAPDEQTVRLIEDNSQVMGTPGTHFYVWDIKNTSRQRVFITLTKDGEPIDPATL